MAISREKKVQIVEDLKDKFARASMVILADCTGLTVGETNELRFKLRDAQGELKVAKNTLVRIAAAGTQVEELLDDLRGPNAMVLAYDDPVAVAKALMEFAKDNDNVRVKVGILEGSKMDADGVIALSKLPSKEVLIAQLLSVMVAPATGLVQALSGIPRKLLYALNAIKDQKEQG